ncbi:MAG: M1 family aminopeptidase [Cytophagales bacterium]|nr:M1 family aminopeptidase [Cytophagales bacterium]
MTGITYGLAKGLPPDFTSLYLEYAYGHERLVEEEKKDRQEIIQFYKKNHAPIVDTTIMDINKVLSTNTYQKAGWVLHMLRHEVGDVDFWKGIRKYYATYQNSNAMTSDFKREMEEASGKDFMLFFHQWLYTGGHPQLNG